MATRVTDQTMNRIVETLNERLIERPLWEFVAETAELDSLKLKFEFYYSMSFYSDIRTNDDYSRVRFVLLLFIFWDFSYVWDDCVTCFWYVRYKNEINENPDKLEALFFNP